MADKKESEFIAVGSAAYKWLVNEILKHVHAMEKEEDKK